MAAGKKFRDFPDYGQVPADTDLFIVSDEANDVTKKVTTADLFANIETPDSGVAKGDFDTLATRVGADEGKINANAQQLTALTDTLDDTLVPRVRAYKTSAQSIPYNVSTVIAFNASRYEVGGTWLNTGTGVITIPSTGHYSGVLTVQFAAGAGGVRELQIKVNDSYLIADKIEDPMVDGTTAKKMQLAFSDDFNAGDTIKCVAFQNQTSAGSMNISAAPHYSPEFTLVKHKHIGTPGTSTGGPGSTFVALPSYTDPYPTSIFNTPIASLTTNGQTVHASSSDIVAGIFSRGNNNVVINEYAGTGLDVNLDWSHAVYYAQPTDPDWTILLTGWQNPLVHQAVIQAPSYIAPAGAGDHSMSIQQQDGSEYALWNVSAIDRATHTITANFGRKGHVSGTGLQESPDPNNRTGGISAAGNCAGLGIIMAQELIDGLIPHALICSVNGWNGRVYPGSTTYTGTTGQMASPDVNGRVVPAMGQHLQLNPSYDISGFTGWKHTILKCAQDYGIYIGDFGGGTPPGPGGWASMVLHLESETAYRAAGYSPTNLENLDSVLPHTAGAPYDINTSVNWASHLRVLKPPT
jgi:hypothetical protein